MHVESNTLQAYVCSFHATQRQQDDLSAAIYRARRLARTLHLAMLVVFWASITLLATLVGAVMAKQERLDDIQWWLVGAMTIALIAIWAFAAVQHLTFFKRWVAHRSRVPHWLPPIYMEVVKAADIVMSSGRLVDPRLLESAFSVLLLSPSPTDRRLVRAPNNQWCDHAIILCPRIDHRHTPAPTLIDHEAMPTCSDAAPTALADDANFLSFERPLSQENRREKPTDWVGKLGIDKKDLLLRIEALDVPKADYQRERVVKAALAASLPKLLIATERGALAAALKDAGDVVRNLQGKSGSHVNSTEWIRKMIAPPRPWLVEQLSRTLDQTELPLAASAASAASASSATS